MLNHTHYLTRIGITETNAPTLNYLAQLQMAHLLHIPFENLDVRRKTPVMLDYERLFDKIVTRRRGGFCFECNGLFGWLLRELGFEVTRITASVYNGKTFGIKFDHMALLVHFDHGTYWVDVGFGDACRRPIKMPNGAADDVSGRYQIVPPSADSYYYFQQDKGKGWQHQYRFTTTAYQMSDFEAGCHYHQTSPLTTFTQRTVCTLATPDGRVTLNDEGLTIRKGAERVKVGVNSAESQAQILATYFNIVL
ncbi:MAG: arylamine N-acetyltransferase family protein [Candidatus Promineifilaceae bacterium]